MARHKGNKNANAKPPRRPHPPAPAPATSSARRGPAQPWAEEAPTTTRFSLVDEASWASRNRSSAFDSGKKLRHMKIEFVSAGYLAGTVKEELAAPEHAPAMSPSPSPSPPPSTSAVNPDAMAQLVIRSPSPADSDSSGEDEIVFKGRGHTPFTQVSTAPSTALPPTKMRTATSPAPPVVAAPFVASRANREGPETTTAAPVAQGPAASEPTPSVSVGVDEPIKASVHLQGAVHVGQKQQQGTPLTAAVAPPDDTEPGSDEDIVVQDQFAKRRGGKAIWEGHVVPWESRSKPGVGWIRSGDLPEIDPVLRNNVGVNPVDAAVQDYMQNIHDSGLQDELVASAGFSRREMDLDAGDHNDWDPGSREAQLEEEEWDTDLLSDFDNLSTSSDVVDSIARILSKRTRATGEQYLVVYQGSPSSDARWLPSSFLKTVDDLQLIKDFEAVLLSRNLEPDSSSELGSSEDDGQNADSDMDGDYGEMTDERLAKILQKQEELGLPSDEVLLYADAELFDGPSNGNVSFDRPSKRRQYRLRGGAPTFPSAAAMADALEMDPYRGFDIMDTDRPSLKPKKTGRRGHPPPELEDPELNEQLQASWQADRVKKRMKKAEREELRTQGLLGRKDKAPDLSVKYKDGVNMAQVVVIIREFMMSENTTVALPPMDARYRKAVHEFVIRFGMDSKSRGAGLNRFTVVSKTNRTSEYEQTAFDAVLDHKKFRKTMQSLTTRQSQSSNTNTTRIQRSTTRIQQGSNTQGGFSYKDGDTVGASAPELGPENKGRAMLEKMGWAKGQALGALDNKGILLPITHTVKMTKAGLK
ncbi:hypothetical protein BDV95DRAFT_613389 [Massariosphaeria phaeospora]|uniref:Protein SQS1 n=1 Tax=Massariosphaeria phaeospora TaxID=100035 RepID=A0A7C8M0Y1_9PLEO|nr:hypothetical protein BDV95DRAFT_613389 [Massariosphaeria phaeospora]